MSLTILPDEPFFTGLSTPSSEVPGKFMVGLAGRGWDLDLESGQYQRQSIPLLRNQADASLQPNEASINPEDLWRRTATSFHKGAGQRNYDAPQESDPARFWKSKGLDPWTKGELSLLPATDEKKTSANTNLFLQPAGAYLYLTDGTSIQYTQDVTVGSPTWTDITGEPATAATGITSDGYNVWSAHGGDGIYATTRGGAATASYAAGTVAGVRYVKGRLFAWQADKLYNVITNTLPTALYDHPNSDFTWVDVGEASGFYYPAGYSGDKSLVYKTAVKADGTGLDTPTVAAELPDGEIIRSIQGYLGFILLGTDKGIRFGSTLTDGSLQLGGLIETDSAVKCFEGQDRFIWFGWTRYDTTSTGLGRMDLSAFNSTRPAYASDLMCTENGDVLSIATFQGIRVFTVSADGVFAQDTVLEPVGTLETGRIGYGIFDPKVSRTVTVSHTPLEGSLMAEMSRNGGDYAEIGSSNTTPGTVRSDFSTNLARGELFELRFTLGRDLSDMTAGPTIGRFTLRAYPASPRSERITVPLLIGKHMQSQSGGRYARDPLDDLLFLASLESDGQSVSYQEGSQTFSVVVEDHIWLPHHQSTDRTAFAGTYLVQLKRFAEE